MLLTGCFMIAEVIGGIVSGLVRSLGRRRPYMLTRWALSCSPTPACALANARATSHLTAVLKAAKADLQNKFGIDHSDD